MKQSFPISSGNLVLDTDTLTWTFAAEGPLSATPVPPIPPVDHNGQDELDMQSVIITSESPDVRGWPIASKLSSIFISPNEFDASDSNMNVDFTRRWGPGAWPIVMGPEGEIQYTLWVASQCGNLNGPWYASAVILCISRGENDNYVPTGPAMRPGQPPQNWYYFAGGPLANYQPQRGEPIAWFLTAGVQRRNDIHALAERTQIVVTAFLPGTYTR